jgi:hypothetical protein
MHIKIHVTIEKETAAETGQAARRGTNHGAALIPKFNNDDFLRCFFLNFII